MAIFQDSCTDTNGTQWQSHTPEIGSITRLWSSGTVNIVINSNAINPETDADDGTIYTLNGTYPSADYKVKATRVAVAVAARPTYMLLRVQDQENMYACRLGGSGAGEGQLYKKVAGTWSTIGTAFAAPAAGSVVEFEVIGSTLKVRDDSTQIASETDTAISAAGKAGFAAGGGAELVTSTDDSHSVNVWDAFLVEDLGGGGTIFTQSAAGTLTTAGTPTKRTKKPLAGVASFVGTLVRKSKKSLAGAVSFAGDVRRKMFEVLAGTLTTAGALKGKARKVLAGTLTTAGTIRGKAKKVLAGTLSFIGTQSARIVFTKALAGTVSFIGTVTRKSKKPLTGTISFIGTVTRKGKKLLAGTLTMARTVTKKTKRVFAGTVSFVGTLASSLVVVSGEISEYILHLHTRTSTLVLQARTNLLKLFER